MGVAAARVPPGARRALERRPRRVVPRVRPPGERGRGGPRGRAAPALALAAVVAALPACAAAPRPAPPPPPAAAGPGASAPGPAIPPPAPPPAAAPRPVLPAEAPEAARAAWSLRERLLAGAAVEPEGGPAEVAPRPAPGPSVDWSPRATVLEPRARVALLTLRLATEPALPAEARAAEWRWLAGHDPRLRPLALRRRAALHRAAGDTLLADSALAALAREPTLWQWEALRQRADLHEARGDPARADAILEAADRSAWPEIERAAWLVRRARLRALLGDTARAAELSRQAMRRYPALSPAGSAVSLLESLAPPAGLGHEDQAAAAQVAALRGDLAAAARRTAAAARGAPPAEAPRLLLRLAEISRQRKRFDEAMKAAREARSGAGSGEIGARAILEEARIHRDAGRREEARRRYEEAAAAGGAVARAAWWEAAREADQAGEWTRARRLYRAAAGARAEEARLRLGLLWLVEGERDSAIAAWAADTSEAARFWSAVARRSRDRAAADAELAALAERPGYDFYRAAARETLGRAGWPGSVARERCEGAGCEALALAGDLLRIVPALEARERDPLRDDALSIVARWSAGDPRAGGEEPPAPRPPLALLAAARLAATAGRLPAAIRYARLAAEAAAAGPDSIAWAVAPWIHPAAHDAALDLALGRAAEPPERALVQAVIWQESKFDPGAVSRSDARGMMQLKVAAATDAAGWLGEPRPTAARLHDPAVNVRYGVAYLARMLRRFEGHPAVALAAYNAGPGRVPAAWRRWVEAGGQALVAEMTPYPETRDYVKRVLSVRQAYREMTPRSDR